MIKRVCCSFMRKKVQIPATMYQAKCNSLAAEGDHGQSEPRGTTKSNHETELMWKVYRCGLSVGAEGKRKGLLKFQKGT